MKKEITICIIASIVIFFGSFYINKYVMNFENKMVKSLESLKTSIQEKDDKNIVKDKLEKAEKNWKSEKDNLSYFLEHNELEKIDINLVSLRSYIDVENEEDSMREIDECIFSVQHLEEKCLFNLKNLL